MTPQVKGTVRLGFLEAHGVTCGPLKFVEPRTCGEIDARMHAAIA